MSFERDAGIAFSVSDTCTAYVRRCVHHTSAYAGAFARTCHMHAHVHDRLEGGGQRSHRSVGECLQVFLEQVDGFGQAGLDKRRDLADALLDDLR